MPSAHALLTKYLQRFKLAPQFTEDEFAHWLLPTEGVVDSFVVRDKGGKVGAPQGIRTVATQRAVPSGNARQNDTGRESDLLTGADWPGYFYVYVGKSWPKLVPVMGLVCH